MNESNTVVQTEDILTWYLVDENPMPAIELLVETLSGYVVYRPGDRLPPGTWRWSKLPPRLFQKREVLEKLLNRKLP
jgi:hypothetical protein